MRSLPSKACLFELIVESNGNSPAGSIPSSPPTRSILPRPNPSKLLNPYIPSSPSHRSNPSNPSNLCDRFQFQSQGLRTFFFCKHSTARASGIQYSQVCALPRAWRSGRMKLQPHLKHERVGVCKYERVCVGRGSLEIRGIAAISTTNRFGRCRCRGGCF